MILQEVNTDGELNFKLDIANWLITDEPEKVSVGDKQYAAGDSEWSFSDSILKLTDFFVGTQNIIINWTNSNTAITPGDSFPNDLPEQPASSDPTRIPEITLLGCVLVVAVLAYGQYGQTINSSLTQKVKKVKQKFGNIKIKK